jgi:spore germination protein GerM
MKRESFPIIPWDTIVGYTALFLTVGGGTAWWVWQMNVPKPQDIPMTAPIVSQPAATSRRLPIQTTPAPVNSEPIAVQPLAVTPQVYGLDVVGSRVYLRPQALLIRNKGISDPMAVETAISELLSSNFASNLTTAVPSGTRLLGMQAKPDEIRINLSQEFVEGGGSEAMIYRVAQVLYTATSLNPQAKVYLEIEGQPVNEDHPLGGEGLVLEQPMTRQSFTTAFPHS